MDEKVYVCTGTCKAEITEEQFKAGLTKCGAEKCTLKGHDFVKMRKCSKCGKIYSPEEKHAH